MISSLLLSLNAVIQRIYEMLEKPNGGMLTFSTCLFEWVVAICSCLLEFIEAREIIFSRCYRANTFPQKRRWMQKLATNSFGTTRNFQKAQNRSRRNMQHNHRDLSRPSVRTRLDTESGSLADGHVRSTVPRVLCKSRCF